MIYRLLPWAVIMVLVAWFVWVCVLHVPSDQHVWFDCPKQITFIDDHPHLCTYVTEDELRCYPMMCRR